MSKYWPLIRFVPRQTHFNFVGLAPYAAVLSALMVIGACVSIGVQQVNWGVDFVGGTKMEVAGNGAVPLGVIRSATGRHAARSATPRCRASAAAAPRSSSAR